MITHDEEVRLVLRGYEVCARDDFDAAVAALAADVEWVEPDDFPDGGARHGPAEATVHTVRSGRVVRLRAHAEPAVALSGVSGVDGP